VNAGTVANQRRLTSFWAMVGRFHLALRATLVAAFVLAGFSADAARVRLPDDGPIPVFNPVAAQQARTAARRGEAAARNVVRVAKRAGKAAARMLKAARAAAKPGLPDRGPIPAVSPTRPRAVEASADADPAKAAKPARKLSAKQARAAAKRGKAAARQVVLWAGRAGKAIRKTANTAANAEAARRKQAEAAAVKPGKRTSMAPLVDREGAVPMPAEEVACRDRLRAANVKFVEEAPLSDPLGCAAPYPIKLQNLGPDFGIKPDAVLNCRMAEAVVGFTRDVIAPAAVQEFETRLKGLRQASGYVCRPRNGSQKLSEHAFGNALDISSFLLEDGSEVTVEATREPDRSVFLSKLRSAACGPFKTVLGPGSDADHALHFHFDLAQRRRGGTFCQ